MEVEKKREFLVQTAYVLVWVALVLLAARMIWMLLLPFLLGLFIAYLLRPVAGFISRHSKMGGRMAAIAAAMAFYAVVGLALWLAGTFALLKIDQWLQQFPQVYQSSIAPALQQMNSRSLGWIHRLAPQLGTSAQSLFSAIEMGAETAVASFSQWCMEKGSGLLQGVPLVLLGLLFTVLCSVLICADYNRVAAFVMRQIPGRLHHVLLDTRDFLLGTLGKVLKAYLLLTLLTLGQLCVGLWILGVPSFFTAALLVALLDLLPVVGSGLVLLPWAVFQLATGSLFQGVGLLVLWAVIALTRQLLEPRVVGTHLGLHPVATVAAMYCGVRLAGFGGLIAAPVLCLLAKHLKEKGALSLYR